MLKLLHSNEIGIKSSISNCYLIYECWGFELNQPIAVAFAASPHFVVYHPSHFGADCYFVIYGCKDICKDSVLLFSTFAEIGMLGCVTIGSRRTGMCKGRVLCDRCTCM